MFESLIAPWRAKYRLAISGAVCYAIAGVAGAIAFAFLLAALFGWLSQQFGSIIASLIIGGAFGNMLDRARIGSVIDFVHLSYQAWSFAIFNVADTAITLGAIATLASLILEAA